MASTDELDGRIQSLPQELQDAIFEYTLEASLADRPEPVTINTDYKPPWQLQLTRVTRRTLVKSYYATSTFLLTDRRLRYDTLVIRWLKSLPRQHIADLTKVLVDFFSGQAKHYVYRTYPPDPNCSEHIIAFFDLVSLRLKLCEANVLPQKKGVLALNYLHQVSDEARAGTWKTVESWVTYDS